MIHTVRTLASPNAIRDAAGVPLGVAWFDVDPGLQRSESLSVGTLDPNLLTWSAVRLTPSGGFADPDGGLNAFRLTDSIDGAPIDHRIRKQPVNHAGGWFDWQVWVQPETLNWALLHNYTTGNGMYVDGSTGATVGYGASPPIVLSTLAASGGYWFNLRWTDVTALGADGLQILTANNVPNWQYQGTGAACVRVYQRSNPFTHIRLAGLGGRMRDTSRALRGESVTQATTANQHLFWASVYYGKPWYQREVGRVSLATTVDPNLLAVANGTDPAFWVVGVWNASGAWSLPIGWAQNSAAFGVHYEIPIVQEGGQLRSYRRGPGGTSVQTIGAGLGSIFAVGTHTFAVIRRSNRDQETWVDGIQLPLVTHGVTGNVASGIVVTADITSMTAAQSTGTVALGSGELPGATAAERYAALRRACQVRGSRLARIAA